MLWLKRCQMFDNQEIFCKIKGFRLGNLSHGIEERDVPKR